MKKFSVFPLIAALAFFVSCQKQQTEEERKAEVERQVQDRLAAERLDADKQRIEQEKAELAAREKAVAEREAGAAKARVEEPAVVTAVTPEVETERTESRTEKQSTATYGMFYQKLDQHGEWRETADYGYVWQPREAEQSREWRPYTEGRWVYSDAGWTWISDEPFGWATYHYGRWLRLKRVGWVWVPGDEWAPAWVSWRTSKDYVGWAPLPPEARFDRRSGIQNWADSYYDIGPDQYSFVASAQFGSEHVRRSVVPAERNISIVIETTNVTRITFANTTIMNEGPSYDELRSRSQRPIERYRLRRQRNTEAPAIVRGEELEISVPVITEIRDMPRPRRIRERVVEVNVDNGWTIADRSAAERARTKIRSESTPPPNAPPKKFVRPAESTTATASATPAAPVATAPAASPSPSAPAASPSVAASPTPASTPVIKPTPAVAASPTATVSPAASATPRGPRPRFSPSATPAPQATSSATAPTTVSPTPVPVASPSVRVRPSASIRPHATPSIAPLSSPAATTPSQPGPTFTPVRRNTPPARIISPAPAITPSTAETTPTQPATKPVPSVTPMKRLTPPPRTMPTPAITAPPRTMPTPAITVPPADIAATPTPPANIPKRMPPRPMPVTTPPSAAIPSAPAESSTPPSADNPKNFRPKRPGQLPTEQATPTPTPANPPN
jgi:hypothetical protein